MTAKGLIILLLVLAVPVLSCAAEPPQPVEDAVAEHPPVEPEPVPPDEAVTVEPEPAPADEVVKPEPDSAHAALLDPSRAAEQAPETFRVRMHTTKGPFVVEVNRQWAPLGADRFYNLVKIGFFEDAAFFRVLEGFVVQFGIHADPAVSARWREATIRDDPVKQPNEQGTLVFATAGPNTRTTQLFVNLVDNSRGLDPQGFAPFGRVVQGMSAVESLYSGYGEGAPRGRGPSQQMIQQSGNRYLKREFPELDYITSAEVIN